MRSIQAAALGLARALGSDGAPVFVVACEPLTTGGSEEA